MTNQKPENSSVTNKNGNFKKVTEDQQKFTAKKEEKKSLKEHKNPIVRALAKVGYIVWLVVLGVGGVLAILISFTAL